MKNSLRLLACLGALFALPVQAATVAEIAMLSGPQRNDILVEGAKKEGKVVLYSAMIEDQALRPLAAAFRKKYPFIAVDYWRADTRDLINKGLAEARANAMVADMLEGGGLSQALMRANVAQAFTTPELARYAKERYDANGFWAATRVSYFGPAYNTKLVKAADVPKTYQDLLDPKWKGKLSWASTVETGGAMMFISFVRSWLGDEKAEAYLRDLSKQNVANLTGSPREIVNRVMQGDYPVALNIFLHHPIISAQKGAPVAPVPLEPVLSNASVLLLMKQAPHPHAAMLFIDYIFSKEGQTVLRDADYFPADPDVEIAKTLESIVPAKANLAEKYLSEEVMFNDRAKALALQKKYFEN